MANMAYTSRVSPLRIEKRALQRVSITDCSSIGSLEEDCGSAEDMSTSPDTSCRSSADADKSFDLEEDFRKKLNKFDDIIEKIKHLRFVHNDDNEDANENVRGTRGVSSENVDNIEYRNTCKSQRSHHIDSEDINNNESNVRTDDNEDCLPLNIRDESHDEERRESVDNGDSVDEEDPGAERYQPAHDESEDSDLIERGPIKPDFQPLRGHPYSMVSWLTRASDNAAHVDYDKTAEQILRNKDFSEKLNPCLDQLDPSRNHSSIGPMVGSLALNAEWTGENADDVYRSGDPANDVSENRCVFMSPQYFGIFFPFFNVSRSLPSSLALVSLILWKSNPLQCVLVFLWLSKYLLDLLVLKTNCVKLCNFI